jgi:hypothetical protein
MKLHQLEISNTSVNAGSCSTKPRLLLDATLWGLYEALMTKQGGREYEVRSVAIFESADNKKKPR